MDAMGLLLAQLRGTGGAMSAYSRIHRHRVARNQNTAAHHCSRRGAMGVVVAAIALCALTVPVVANAQLGAIEAFSAYVHSESEFGFSLARFDRPIASWLSVGFSLAELRVDDFAPIPESTFSFSALPVDVTLWLWHSRRAEEPLDTEVPLSEQPSPAPPGWKWMYIDGAARLRQWDLRQSVLFLRAGGTGWGSRYDGPENVEESGREYRPYQSVDATLGFSWYLTREIFATVGAGVRGTFAPSRWDYPALSEWSPYAQIGLGFGFRSK